MNLKKIKSIFIFINFVITVTIVIILMRLFKSKNWSIRRAWAKLQAPLIGYKLDIKGTPSKEAKLLLINHQSLLDIIVLENIYPNDIAWVAKKEIAQIPFFGQILTLPDMIIIDRDDRKSLVKLFKDVKDRLKNNRTIAIFPEGTRGRGDKLLKFKSGAKLIAQKLDLIVQPVVLVNTREILDSQNFSASSGLVKVIYLDPINPKDDPKWYENLHDKMQETLVNELQLLNKD